MADLKKKENVKENVAAVKESVKENVAAVKENVAAVKESVAKEASELTKTASAVVKEAATKANTVKKAVKKTAAKRVGAKKAKLQSAVYVQFDNKNISSDGLVERVKEIMKSKRVKVSDLKDIKVYVNVSESKAYYVVNEDMFGEFEL